MTATFDIPSLLPWTAGKLVETKRGWKNLRTAPPDEAFWAAWRDPSSKNLLVAAGVSVGKAWDPKTKAPDPDRWEVCWWGQPPDHLSADTLNRNIEASQAVDAEIDIPRPAGQEYLPFQKAGCRFALKIFNPQPGSKGGDALPISPSSGVLIADEMGLGKTVMSLGVLNSMPDIRRVLVVVPESLRLNWQRELAKWLVRPMTVGIASAKTMPATDIMIVGYSTLHRFTETLGPVDLVVFDEIHFLKEKKSRRAQAAHAIVARYKLGLTGTPMLNRVPELFTICNLLAPDVFPNWWKFVHKYCGATQGSWGMEFNPSDEGLAQLQKVLRSRLMVRRLKADVMKELPPKRRQVIEIQNGGSAEDEIDNYERGLDHIEELQAALELAKVSDSEAEYQAALKALQDAVGAHFEEISRVRHETAVRKLPYTLAHLEECLADGRKVVVFAHHRDCVEAIQEYFGNRCVHHYGGMSDEDKQTAVDRFQTDPTCVLFAGSILASGMGITLTASTHVVFHELDWRPAMVSQAEDRCHRIGAKGEFILVQHLVLSGSLDARMAELIVEKQELCDKALDRDRESLRIEPIVPVRRSQPKPVSLRKKEIEEQAVQLTLPEIQEIHRKLQIIAGMCDNAHRRDGAGFSKIDAAIGHSLAEQFSLTPRQAVLGNRLVQRYRKQLLAVL